MRQLDFYCSFPEVGCALSKHPASCQQSATGVVSREDGRRGWGIRQVYQNLPVSCSQPLHLSKLSVGHSTLSLSVSEYPVTSGWWWNVNDLLMFRLLICSLTHHTMAGSSKKKKKKNPSRATDSKKKRNSSCVEILRGMERRKKIICLTKEDWEQGDPNWDISGVGWDDPSLIIYQSDPT